MGKRRTNVKDPTYGGIVLPLKLMSYTADLSSLGAFLRPNRLMGNNISRELARGEHKVPIYTPYMVPNSAESPGQFRLLNIPLPTFGGAPSVNPRLPLRIPIYLSMGGSFTGYA